MNLDHYQEQVAKYFDARKETYDVGEFHKKLAQDFVSHLNIQQEEKILDIATGTGLVALEAAKLVGPFGRVVGVDISAGLLEVAKTKKEVLHLGNVEFQLADAENLPFVEQSFDVICCCSALPFLRDIPIVLKKWKQLLKPKGRIGFNGFSDCSHVIGLILREAAEKYDVYLPLFNGATGTADKTKQLLVDAGFANVTLKEDDFSHYITLQDAQKTWDTSLTNPLCQELRKLSTTELDAMKHDYFQKIQNLNTQKGIFNQITAFTAITIP